MSLRPRRALIGIVLTGAALAALPASAMAAITPDQAAGTPYAPTITGSITRDATDSGATVDIAITQAANESASKSIVVTTPAGLAPNFGADVSCLSVAPCQIGTATATSPGVPSAALANGTVTLGGSAVAPTLLIAFPPPAAITLTGGINLANNTVTFDNLPNVLLTSLALHITGPGGQKAFNTDCVPANVSGAFTAQSGATATSTAAVAFNNCPSAVARSARGLASGQPSLKFSVTRGTGGTGVAAVAIGVPTGLKFDRSAFVSHKSCTSTGKNTCTTTTLIMGLGVTGAKAKTVALRGGKLVITLKKPANSVTITVSGPLVTESKALQSAAKKHKVKNLKFTLKLTDANRNASTVSAAVRPR